MPISPGSTRAPRAWPWVGTALLGAVAGCGGEVAAGASAGPVRLVERVAAPGFPGPRAAGQEGFELRLDPRLQRDLSPSEEVESFAALDGRARILEARSVAALLLGAAGEPALPGSDEPGRTAAQNGGESVHLVGPQGLARVIPKARGQRSCFELRFRPSAAESARLLLLEVPKRLMPTRIESDEWLADLLAFRGQPRHALDGLASGAGTSREVGPDGLVTTLVDFRPRRRTRALVFLALVPSGSLELEHLEVHATPRSVTDVFAPSHEFGVPWVRRVEIDKDFRESILLPAPGTLELELRVPASEPQLAFGLAAVGGRAGDRIELVARVAARGDARSEPVIARAWVEPSAGRWQEVALDLSSLAGMGVELSFEARAPGDGRFRLLALGAPVLAGRPPGGAAALPPDVILISLDTVRADRLSLHGAARPTSPALERLAADAVVFERAVTTAPWTLPAHMSVFTGRLPERHGVTDTKRRLAPGRGPNLGTTLRAAGYRTLAFTGGGYVHPDFGFGTGFERYGVVDVARQEPRVGIAPGSPAARRRDELLRILAEPRRRPLFLFLHSYVAHNYVPVAADLERLGADPGEVERMPGGGSLGMKRYVARARDRAEAEARIELLYDSTLLAADRLVGDVVDALRASGRFERTLLVVFSDHGEELFEHGRHGHCRYLWEELVHVPLLVKPPFGSAGRVSDVVSLIDLAPTLHELLGLTAGGAMDGRSLVPLLEGRALAPRPAMAQAGVEHAHALRDGPLKLILSGEPLLFDLAADPAERANLAPELADQRARLEQELRRRVAEGIALREAGALDAAELDPELELELGELGYTGG